jgi:hypothetical protein
MVSITSDIKTQQCADGSSCTDMLVKEEKQTLKWYKGCKCIPCCVSSINLSRCLMTQDDAPLNKMGHTV